MLEFLEQIEKLLLMHDSAEEEKAIWYEVVELNSKDQLLLITTRALYIINCEKDTVKRCIEVDSIHYITASSDPETTMLINFKDNSESICLRSQSKKEIMKIIKNTKRRRREI